MSTHTGSPRRPSPRHAVVAGVVVLCLASLMVAVTAGARTPSAEPVGKVGSPGGALDYAKDADGRLRPLRPDFVAQSLGLLFAPRSAAANPVVTAGGGLGADGLLPAAPPTNPVATPVLPCVNGHQTEDPLSPPCVAQFTGDNGGATYRGVSGSEVRILVVAGLHDLFTLRHPTDGHYYDLEAPPSADETANMPWMQRLRLLQTYFNRRYQTYGRRVHLWATAVAPAAGEATRAQARLDDTTVRPFAVLLVPGLVAFGPEYADELARRGVATFTVSRDMVDDDALSARPGLQWAHRPGSREAADLYGSYLCQKVVHQPVVASGNPGENGHPRRLGLLQVSDPRESAEFGGFTELVRRRVVACGGTFVDTERYREPNGCATQVEDEAGGGTGTDDPGAMAGFKAHGVTTVIWPACLAGRMARSAEAIGYLPEWVLWGAGALDQNLFSSVEAWPAAVWDGHAVVVTPGTFRPDVPQRLCYRAMASEDPRTPADDVADTMCDYYEGLRQVLTNLQVAGPYLTPQAMDRGVRSLRAAPVSDPQTPRCVYPAGDYTCVKDAQVEWWDSLGPGDPTPPILGVRTFGCWRSMEGGRRYTAGTWPPGNIDAQRSPGDPCNLFGAHVALTPLPQ